ncbi:MAG: GIY-YIG nuclease family protein, partial [Nanopusillaceae archaeon]
MKGIYIIILECLNDIKIKVGSLGEIEFKKGYYFYIGSALNNLEKRIERHLRKNKKIYWHIDYLTTNNNFRIIEIYYKETNRKEECKIAKYFEKYFDYIKNFGNSDCNDNSHLFYSRDLDKIRKIINKLNFLS